MANVALFDTTGKRAGEIELSESIFAVEPKEHLVHDAVRMDLANMRSGTHDTKTRAEVSGGGKKPWRQKGTGRARQGSTRSPIWRHGGVVWGPHQRDYSMSMPKKMRRLAFLSALSDKAAQGQVVIIEDIQLEKISTKAMAGILNSMELEGRILMVLGANDDTIAMSTRNIAGLEVRVAPAISVYEVLRSDVMVITRSAVARMEEVFGK